MLCFSSYFALSVFTVLWFTFACRWLCSSLACRWLCSCACCYFFLLGFSPLAPWLWFRLCFFQSHLVVGCDSVARFWLPPTSLLNIAPFVIGGCAVSALDPREGSSQQLVLFLRSCLRESLLLLIVGVLQCHCVMLWTVSTFIMKAYIAASCHCVVIWFFRRCWAYRSSCLFLSSGSS